MKYYCNPLNVVYRYQFNKPYGQKNGPLSIDREAMVHWENYKLPDNLPFYDYAPDVRVMGDYVYFCASSHDHPCSHYRTKDVINEPYEEMEAVVETRKSSIAALY